jgi:2-amino-4-hydroxy-6-hydroxymethyldihydropteridine diphosphokinase
VSDGDIFIALGSNLGDRAATLRTALVELAGAGDVQVLRSSSFHETAPVGGPPGQGPYLNAVAELASALAPEALLARLLEIEQRHGRVRSTPNAPRTLDLDLLLYRRQVVCTPALTVPHPRMWSRAFVLAPLEELCGPQRVAELRNWAASVGAPGAGDAVSS